MDMPAQTIARKPEPCPICGATPKVIRAGQNDRFRGEQEWWVECETPTHYLCSKALNLTRDEAVADWAQICEEARGAQAVKS